MVCSALPQLFVRFLRLLWRWRGRRKFVRPERTSLSPVRGLPASTTKLGQIGDPRGRSPLETWRWTRRCEDHRLQLLSDPALLRWRETLKVFADAAPLRMCATTKKGLT
jgi:hypothetical protein